MEVMLGGHVEVMWRTCRGHEMGLPVVQLLGPSQVQIPSNLQRSERNETLFTKVIAITLHIKHCCRESQGI